MENTELGASEIPHSGTGDAANAYARLREEVRHQLAAFHRRRRRDKRKAFVLRMSTVVLSAGITVLLGVRVAGSIRELFVNVALVLGALSTVAAAIEVFFAHRELWVLRTRTVRRLEGLDRRLAFHAVRAEDEYSNYTELQHFLAELEAILAEDLSLWHQLRASRSGVVDTGGESLAAVSLPTK